MDDKEILVRLHAHVCADSAVSSICEPGLDQQLDCSWRERPAGVVFVDSLTEIEESNL